MNLTTIMNKKQQYTTQFYTTSHSIKTPKKKQILKAYSSNLVNQNQIFPRQRKFSTLNNKGGPIHALHMR